LRKEIPLLITLLSGLVYVVANFFNVPLAKTVKGELDQWFLIATAFAVLLGVVNLTMIHVRNLMSSKSGKFYSLVLLVAMYGTIAIGLFQTNQGPFYQGFIFNRMINPLSATMYSILVFYISSAAYRAFRVRSFEATLLLLTAVIVMIGRVPIGDIISPYIPQVTSWLQDVPNTAGMRGIMIGIALGGVATALRVIVGLERTYLSGGE
jgi:hypothetical protein